jgi:hypothetical protein
VEDYEKQLQNSVPGTGDLFSEYGRLHLDDTAVADKEKWMHAVSWIEKRIMNIDKVIEGHGQILSVNDLRQFNNNIMSLCAGPQNN